MNNSTEEVMKCEIVQQQCFERYELRNLVHVFNSVDAIAWESYWRMDTIACLHKIEMHYHKLAFLKHFDNRYGNHMLSAFSCSIKVFNCLYLCCCNSVSNLVSM